ncbi:hypothetical protein CIG19_02750 [Enterobacterales bacterium CwR94]|nr:hypothetical protein CIG19_02750 [Enterobacterales bacterium CwR94]
MKPSTFQRHAQAFIQHLNESQHWLAEQRQRDERWQHTSTLLSPQLHRAQSRTGQLQEAAAQPFTLGILGYSARGKQALQQHIVHADPAWQQCVQLLSPGRSVAIRLSSALKIRDQEVQLTLLSQADVIAVLSALSPRVWREADEPKLHEHLQTLERRSQHESQPGMDEAAVAALWQQCRLMNTSSAVLDRAFWPRALRLVPWLTADDRQHLFRVLWQDELRCLAHCQRAFQALETLSECRMLWLSLTLFNAQDPLSMAGRAAHIPLSVVPVINGQRARARTITQSELSLLAAELRVPQDAARENGCAKPLDVLVLPAGGHFDLSPLEADTLALAAAKSRWLLARASWAQQCDMLMIATAATQREQAMQMGQALWRWQQDRDVQVGDKPAIIWCLSQWDQRVVQAENFDSAVQRAVGTAGEQWGAMLTSEPRDVTRMLNWLTPNVDTTRRMARLATRLAALRADVCDRLLSPLLMDEQQLSLSHKKQIAEQLLKTLQKRAGIHGEMLESMVPPREQIRAWWQQDAHSLFTADGDDHDVLSGAGDWGLDIDLFASSTATAAAPVAAISRDRSREQAQAMLNLWLAHLQTRVENHALLSRLTLDPQTVALLMQETAVAIQRLKIVDLLAASVARTAQEGSDALRRVERQTQCVLSVMGDFVAWLGFQQVAESARPASRVNQGHPIFARPPQQTQLWDAGKRLTRLEARPVNTTAFYIYDWLVALNTLIEQNAGYSATPLPGEARDQLAVLLAGLQG